MDDETIEKVAIDFCKPPADADQGASVGRMLGDSPAPAKQLSSISALQITPQSKFTPTHQRQGEPGLSEQKKRTMGEQKLNQEKIGGEGVDMKELDPDPSLHSAELEEGMTHHCNRQHKPDPTMRDEGFTVGYLTEGNQSRESFLTPSQTEQMKKPNSREMILIHRPY